MLDTSNPWTTFCLAAALSGAAGAIRQLVKRRSRADFCGIVATGLHSGTWGLGISMVWHDYFRDNIYALLGGCILAALAGTLSAQELLSWARIGFKALEAIENSRGDRTKDSGRKTREPDDE